LGWATGPDPFWPKPKRSKEPPGGKHQVQEQGPHLVAAHQANYPVALVAAHILCI